MEEFYDKKPDLANINYFNGKEETEIVLKINQEELNQWLDDINGQKAAHEDDEDIDDLDFEKSEVETKYILAELFESNLKRRINC